MFYTLIPQNPWNATVTNLCYCQESFDYGKQLQEILSFKKQHDNVTWLYVFDAYNQCFCKIMFEKTDYRIVDLDLYW